MAASLFLRHNFIPGVYSSACHQGTATRAGASHTEITTCVPSLELGAPNQTGLPALRPLTRAAVWHRSSAWVLGPLRTREQRGRAGRRPLGCCCLCLLDVSGVSALPALPAAASSPGRGQRSAAPALVGLPPVLTAKPEFLVGSGGIGPLTCRAAFPVPRPGQSHLRSRPRSLPVRHQLIATCVQLRSRSVFHVTLLLVSGQAVSPSGAMLPTLRTPWPLLVLRV